MSSFDDSYLFNVLKICLNRIKTITFNILDKNFNKIKMISFFGFPIGIYPL